MVCGLRLVAAALVSTCSVARCTAGTPECQEPSCQKTEAPTLLQKKESLVSAVLEASVDMDASELHDAEMEKKQSLVSAALEGSVDMDASELHDAEMEKKQSLVSAALEDSVDMDASELYDAEMEDVGDTTCDVFILHAEIVTVANSGTSSTITATWYRESGEGEDIITMGSKSLSGISSRAGWDATWILYNPSHNWGWVRISPGGDDGVLLDNLRMSCGVQHGPGYTLTTQKSWGARNDIGWCLSTDHRDGFSASVQSKTGNDSLGGTTCNTMLLFSRDGSVTCDDDPHHTNC